ncbi:Uncharacterised protein [Mobiluncus mulieris]|nr:Uncharacterised protein [Mobiluncus mulieris]
MFLEDGDRVVIVNPSVQALLELQNDFAGEKTRYRNRV